MDALYYISIILILVLIPTIIVGLIRPQLYGKILKKHATRPRVVLLGVILFFVFAITLTITEPASVKTARLAREQAATQAQQLKQQQEAEAKQKAEEENNKETTEEVIEKQTVVFTEQTKEDGSLAKGQTKVAQEGQNGEKTITYVVTYKGGTETERTVKSEEVTKQPIAKITSVGTYVAPAATSSGGSGYTNSQGNYVPSPSSDPAGATAKCRDGTYSYSQSRSGTCSHHGGVASWL